MGKACYVISCMLLVMSGIAGCSKASEGQKEAGSAADPSSMVVARAKPQSELITLRGLSFDGPDIRQEITDMCLSDAKKAGLTEESRRKINYWCKFDRKGHMSMYGFQYGNLGGLSSSSSVLVDEGGVLLAFWSSGTKNEMLELAATLEGKYGKPAIAESQVTNGVGTKFDKKTFVWTDVQGNKITLESVYNRIDEGRVVIEARSHQTATQMREKIQREVYKQKL